MSHTPGPWHVRIESLDGLADSPDVFASDCRFIASCGCSAQANANARLIAAAPDLLAVLKSAREPIEADLDMHTATQIELLTQIDAAIAKAEGR